MLFFSYVCVNSSQEMFNTITDAIDRPATLCAYDATAPELNKWDPVGDLNNYVCRK